MIHRYLAPLRWGDMDAQAHLNNGAFVDHLQEARVHFLLSGPPAMVELLDAGVLVVQHQLEYLRPVAVAGQQLGIDLWVDAVGGSRFVIGYTVHDGVDEDAPVAVRARTVVCPYDLAGSRLRRLDAVERAHLVEALRPAEPLPAEPRVRWSAGRGHHYELYVRWGELDSYGHINNVTYYDYVQEARIALLGEALGWAGTPDEGPWVVVRQDVDYLRPIDFRLAPYAVETVVTAVGNRSLRLAAEIGDPDSGTVFAAARTVLVGPAPFSTEQRDALETYGIGTA